MNQERRNRLQEALDILTEVRDEEQEAHDNLPESFQNGEQGEAMEEHIDNSTLATTPIRARQSRRGASMSKDRKDVYLGDGLRRALKGRKESLSTSVNLIADRYQAIVERALSGVDITPHERALALEVLAESRGHRLEGREIAAFPVMVQDYCLRHKRDDAFASRLQALVERMDFDQLVAFIDYLERQP